MQGYLAHEKHHPPLDHRRALGIVLLQGPEGALFVMREVPLYAEHDWQDPRGQVPPHRKKEKERERERERARESER